MIINGNLFFSVSEKIIGSASLFYTLSYSIVIFLIDEGRYRRIDSFRQTLIKKNCRECIKLQRV